jgi:hypothetical protein
MERADFFICGRLHKEMPAAECLARRVRRGDDVRLQEDHPSMTCMECALAVAAKEGKPFPSEPRRIAEPPAETIPIEVARPVEIIDAPAAVNCETIAGAEETKKAIDETASRKPRQRKRNPRPKHDGFGLALMRTIRRMLWG